MERLENIFDDIETLYRNDCIGELYTRLLKAKEIIEQVLNENFSGQSTLSPYLRKVLKKALNPHWERKNG